MSKSTSATAPSSLVFRVLTHIIIPVGIVGTAVVLTVMMIMSRTEAPQVIPAQSTPMVEFIDLKPTSQPAVLIANGVVKPSREVRITPEVSGKITSQSPSLMPGARFRRGELIAQIDTRNYRAAVANQERAVTQAELNLALEEGRGKVARREWELLGSPSTDPRLALREPQLLAAQKSLEAAQAALVQAQANLSRTRITAPFNGIVVTESLEIGQVVGPNTPAATLIGTDAFWVQVSIPVEKLEGLRFRAGRQPGSIALIEQVLGDGRTINRTAEVLRSTGQLDPQTRTAQIILEIPDPYDAASLPLLPGAPVRVRIDGKELHNTWTIPRETLVNGEYVWVIDQENSLRKREVVIGWRTPDAVIATAGIVEGDRLIVSPLRNPIEGQAVEGHLKEQE